MIGFFSYLLKKTIKEQVFYSFYSLKYFNILILLSSFICLFPSSANQKHSEIIQNSPNYGYEIKIYPQSKLNYTVQPQEILLDQQIALKPNLRIEGILKVFSEEAAENIRIRLSSSSLKAKRKEEEIDTMVRGYIGNKYLSEQFVQPEFNQFNEVLFVIEGFIDGAAFKKGLGAGVYDYSIDDSIFDVQFY